MARQSYLFFLNSQDFGYYKGFVGLGLRELDNDEFIKYCLNSSKPNKPPYYIQQKSSNKYLLTSDFYFVVYTSGCYYIDQSTGKWSSYGLEVMNDTTLSYTHCKSNHLTTFASGFEILPFALDFNYVFANSSFEQNKTIYLTVLILFALYILFSIWGRWMDKQDFLKIGVTPLIDNNPIDDYFYEILVITGNRVNAGTDSKVIPYLF
jgi:magnesium-transporting ATPase (P-type)